MQAWPANLKLYMQDHSSLPDEFMVQPNSINTNSKTVIGPPRKSNHWTASAFLFIKHRIPALPPSSTSLTLISFLCFCHFPFSAFTFKSWKKSTYGKKKEEAAFKKIIIIQGSQPKGDFDRWDGGPRDESQELRAAPAVKKQKQKSGLALHASTERERASRALVCHHNFAALWRHTLASSECSHFLTWHSPTSTSPHVYIYMANSWHYIFDINFNIIFELLNYSTFKGSD